MSVNAINVDSAGVELAKPPTYAAVYPVTVRQSAASAAAVVAWALWNPTGSVKIVHVRSIQLQMFFDGTAAATLMKYELIKYTGVTALTGAVAVSALHKRTSLSGAKVSSAGVLDTGITMTGGAAQVGIPIGAQGRVTQTATNFQSTLLGPLSANERGTINAMAIELAAQEALAIRLLATAVIGDNIVGLVEIAEI